MRERLIVIDDSFNRSLKKLQRTKEDFLERSADVLEAEVQKPEGAFSFLRKPLNPDPDLAKAILLGRPVDR